MKEPGAYHDPLVRDEVLCDIGYQGYVSAEALPYPDPVEAARPTMTAHRKYFAP